MVIPNVAANSFTKLLIYSVLLSEGRTSGLPQRVKTMSRNESIIFFALTALRGLTSIYFVNRP